MQIAQFKGCYLKFKIKHTHKTFAWLIITWGVVRIDIGGVILFLCSPPLGTLLCDSCQGGLCCLKHFHG